MFNHSENLTESEKQGKIESTRSAKEVCGDNYEVVKEHRALKQQDKMDDLVRRDNAHKMMDQYTESENQKKTESTRSATEVCEENYQVVKEHRALKEQDKINDQVRSDSDHKMMDQYTESEKQKKIESTRSAMEVCRDNYEVVKEHRALKQQNKMDDQVRSDYDDKMMNQYAVDMKARDKDNLDKRTEYGEFLSKQINDKERQKHKEVESGMTSAFNEESIDPATEKMEFLNKRENDDMENQEQAIQRAEDRGMWKYEVASTWGANNNEAVKREKIVDTLIEQDLQTVKASNEKLEDQLEAQKKINAKKELLKQMEKRNELTAQQAAEEKKELQKLLADVAKDEETQQKLKDEEKQKKIESNKSVLNSLCEKAERLKMDSNNPWK